MLSILSLDQQSSAKTRELSTAKNRYFHLVTWCDHVLLLIGKYRIEMLREFTMIS